ncbi:MAG: AAA family ATPase, partial [Ktedonobacterales bacterium]|nr:AAA family ATPase [Ktedonobacterales bacterium]
MQHQISDDLDLLLAALPPHLAAALAAQPQHAELIEVVMDLGRLPEARFPNGEVILSEDPISDDDIHYVMARTGDFGDDNRAGMERTLHRISAIRNRRGKVIGLTCRVGRAVYGTVALIRDVVEQGRSLLILGRPGVGKTTILREVARVLADDLGKRVVIVDTSNEIAGDGDVPHPGIGRARRMQVARPAEQHAVMIEAVENHMPEVIIIDEIGTELEALAARTIAERGVQLVGTAHGNTLDNLLLNPTLSDLVGGISSVTLGDEEARRRGTQKSVLERKAPPTFDVVVEQQERQRILVHADVAGAVDALLRGDTPVAEERILQGEQVRRSVLHVASTRPELAARPSFGGARGERGPAGGRVTSITAVRENLPPVIPQGRLVPMPALNETAGETDPIPAPVHLRNADGILRLYIFGVNHERVGEVAQEFGTPIQLVENLRDADAVVTHQNIFRRQGDRLAGAQDAHIPIFMMRNPGVKQLRDVFAHMLGTATPTGDLVTLATGARDGRRVKRDIQLGQELVGHALQEAEDAIHHLLAGVSADGVELTPQGPRVRRMQHLLAERYNLQSKSYGKEPRRRVYIYSA